MGCGGGRSDGPKRLFLSYFVMGRTAFFFFFFALGWATLFVMMATNGLATLLSKRTFIQGLNQTPNTCASGSSSLFLNIAVTHDNPN